MISTIMMVLRLTICLITRFDFNFAQEPEKTVHDWAVMRWLFEVTSKAKIYKKKKILGFLIFKQNHELTGHHKMCDLLNNTKLILTYILYSQFHKLKFLHVNVTHVISIIRVDRVSLPRPKTILTFCLVEHIRLKIFARRRRAGEVLLTSIWKTHDAEANHLETS